MILLFFCITNTQKGLVVCKLYMAFRLAHFLFRLHIIFNSSTIVLTGAKHLAIAKHILCPWTTSVLIWNQFGYTKREYVCKSNNGILHTIVGLLKIATSLHQPNEITQSTSHPPCFIVGWGLFLVHAAAVDALDFYWSSGAASCALFLGRASFMWRSNKVAIEAASSWF